VLKRIELLVGLDDAFGRAVARGVIRYAKTRRDWKLYGYGRMFHDVRELETQASPGADGIIARVETSGDARTLAALGIPVVDVAGAYPGLGFHEANNDDFLTGRRAGEYLRGLGFRRFTFCGVQGTVWSGLRREGFLEACGSSRAEIPVFERPLAWWKDREEGTTELSEWLRKIPVPSALFACNDAAGLKSAETCALAGIQVPSDLAVLGVDDEDLLCELSDPSLSSVRLDCEAIGGAAATLLDQALRGEATERGRTRAVAPVRIVERESTRIWIADDPLVAMAISRIQADGNGRINATKICAQLPACKRSVEKRFRLSTGKTLHQAILDARLDRAKRLLSQSDYGLETIAEASGFGSLQRFHLAFKKREGLTPGAWRKAGRGS